MNINKKINIEYCPISCLEHKYKLNGKYKLSKIIKKHFIIFFILLLIIFIFLYFMLLYNEVYMEFLVLIILYIITFYVSYIRSENIRYKNIQPR